MKILPFKIPKSGNEALIIQEDQEELFYNKLHQHPEIQMSYILSGSGTLITGDSVGRFEPGDVLIFGSNLPHVFRSDAKKSKRSGGIIPCGGASEKSHMLSVFFKREAFGIDFFKTEELSELDRFFEQAASGFRIQDQQAQFKKYFKKLQTSGLPRFLHFVELLIAVHKTPKELLSNFTNNSQYTDREGKRMSRVFDFCMNHFQEPINLRSISRVAVMSPTAFCRFFKERTNKTFTEFLTSLRIEQACQLLKTPRNKEPIATIAYSCGFNSVSNFNRYFKKLKGISPREYQKLAS